MAALAPGTLVAARFRLRRRLGAGGLAEVFSAADEQQGGEVALKALHRHLVSDAGIAERFHRELRATRSLVHPSIVRVHELHLHEGRPLFTMELLRGRTLADRVREGPLPVPEALEVARALCGALDCAHRAGVVHRDLKPQNVFLCDGAGAGCVKLLDFGLARVAGWARLTAQSTVMGTPGYIAPELLEGRPSDGRADLWSLGATLFELLTGRRPYPDDDPYQVLRRQREPPPSPRALRPELPPELDRLVIRALAPDPEARFLDAGQLLRALGGEPVPAAPPATLVLVRGDWTVEVASIGPFTSIQRRELRALAAGLGIADAGWFVRSVGVFRRVPGAERISRESAERLRELCQEVGLSTRVRPADPERSPGGLERWLSARRWSVPGAWGLAAVAAAPLAGAAGWGAFAAAPLFLEVGIPAFTALVGAVTGGGFWIWAQQQIARARAERVPVHAAADPAVARLAAGLQRRQAALAARLAALPPARRTLLGELEAAIRACAEEGARALQRAAALPDPLVRPEEAPTLPAGLAADPGARDREVQRLLALAAALDDAQAVLEAAAGADPSAAAVGAASGALRRLRQELAAAAAPSEAGEAAPQDGAVTPVDPLKSRPRP